MKPKYYKQILTHTTKNDTVYYYKVVRGDRYILESDNKWWYVSQDKFWIGDCIEVTESEVMLEML